MNADLLVASKDVAYKTGTLEGVRTLAGYANTGKAPHPHGNKHAYASSYFYDTKDGQIMLAASNHRQNKRLFETVGRPELGDSDNETRAKNFQQEEAVLREIMQLDLNADLVVLSACEMANGRVGAGEGLIGMSWALFVAGSPSTVANLWKTDASASGSLMVDFHRELKSGATKSDALRQAMLATMKKPEFRHPFYWAGFELIGNPF